MSLSIASQNLPQPIVLPPIDIVPIPQAIGAIYCRLRSQKVKQVVRIEEINITERKTEKVYVLDDGERIIITERKKLIRPHGIDGVLIISGDSSKWLSHTLVDSFENEKNTKGLAVLSKEIESSWTNKFSFIQERKDGEGNIIFKGLRPPQIGSLHAIGSHWSLYSQVATIVMPTGTGKTETMLAASIAYQPGGILVTVPSKVLRQQTQIKFMTLGLLRLLGTIGVDVKNPIVGVISKRPTSSSDLEIFDNCNVVISTMSAISSEETAEFLPEIASKVDVLIVDEAHHVAAKTWLSFREHFKNKKILQFTATPYRRDGKLVDGKVIFNYPLHSAQADGYFKPIKFESIHEVDESKGDREIAIAAVTN
jgi:hypothetical protein